MSKLIQKVSAQAAPTFPYDGPFEEPQAPATSGDAIARLTASTTSIQQGQTVTIDLEVQSNQEEIENYLLTISFNASVLEVVDANTTQSGIQVKFLDSFSTEQKNTADNTAGSIQLQASVSGAAQPINRRIAQITFRAKQTGTSVISVNKAQSNVTNDAGKDVLASTKSLNLTVTGETQTDGNGGTQPQLPQSGLSDTLASTGMVLAALLMLYIGVRMVVEKKKGREIGI